MAYITTHTMPPKTIKDEMKLFDRSSFCIVTTVECETDLHAVRQSLKA
ncbi:hypothetical protein ABVV53_13345 [Novosphingobium sp. RD2P27]|uniref:Uncharacterized protein n=1 Tax=Novosphingobium kalidii TaxID=3230299 RepID=A0ABV2D3I1_9SPHN